MCIEGRSRRHAPNLYEIVRKLVKSLKALKQRSKHGWVKNVVAKSVNSLSITFCSRSLYILLLLFSYHYYYYFFLRNVCTL